MSVLFYVGSLILGLMSLAGRSKTMASITFVSMARTAMSVKDSQSVMNSLTSCWIFHPTIRRPRGGFTLANHKMKFSVMFLRLSYYFPTSFLGRS